MKCNIKNIKSLLKVEKSEIISGVASFVILGLMFIFYISAYETLNSMGLLEYNTTFNLVLPLLFLIGIFVGFLLMIITLGKITQYIGKRFIDH